ncbi:MAG: ABC transporter ATP-binding protein [Candidatus Omnitrophica bacterium]|nr:ABC transporter ATP-binding protein [Candidatus Omnitrophota bacterium]
MNTPYIIQVENLDYSYPDGTEAIRDISFAVADGEKLALIGPNGAGKSTLLLLLNGVIRAGGRIIIDGIELAEKTIYDIRRRIGLVFQDPDDQLFSPTVFDDVAFAPMNAGAPEDEIRRRVEEALGFVDLAGYEKKSPFHLSFGEKKRISLAGVLAQRPKILLLDEPTSNLDPKHRRRMIEWMKEFDGTLLVATHDLDMAYEVSNRCLVLNAGRVTAESVTESILKDKDLLEKNSLELPLSFHTLRPQSAV